MKKSIRRFVSAACIALVSLSILGCDTGDKKQSAGSGNKVQIEYWHVASESFGGKTVKELVQDFNASHPDIEVVEKYNPDMYKGLTQNLQAAVASGKNPDVVQMGYSYLNYAAENFKYVDIPSMVEKIAPDDKNYFDQTFTPKMLQLAKTDDGKQVGLPYSVSVPVIYYNPEIFKQAGLDPEKPPTTWKEVAEDAAKIQQATGNKGFFMQEYADNWAQQALIESNGGHMLVKENGKVKAGFNSPEAVQAYQLMADMVKNGSALHATNEEAFQAFLSGKLGIVCTTIGKRANFESSAKFPVKVAAFPAFDGKEVKVPAGGNFLMIFSKDEAKQKAAWEFVKYLESAKALEKWTTGTGYLPPVKDIEKSPEFKKLIDSNPNVQVALKSLANVVPWASFPGANGLQAEQALIDVRDVILSGQKSAQDALQETADKINGLLP